MNDSTVFSKNKEMVTRDIDEETVLLPIFKSSDELSYIYTLNDMASWVWKMIDGKKTIAGIKKRAMEEFEGTDKQIDKEIKKFFSELEQIKAIVKKS